MNKENKPSEREDRIAKIKQLQALGISPYPAKAKRSHQIATALADYDTLATSVQSITVVGRLRRVRDHGNIGFADLEDTSGRLQLVLSKADLGDKYKQFVKLIDNSDFLQATGTLFTTQAGEKSLKVSQWRLLTKALRSVPSEWFGLSDEDERLRHRYLDIILNPELKELIIKKDKFWNAIRQFLKQRNFIEVETPVLETMTGGADARPFVTHHNALDLDVFLRISTGELWQKKLMVAGLEKTFEIGRQFRNEGMDAEHAQDYTQMEFYWSYADYEQGMALVEEMYKYVAQETFGTLQFTIGKFEVDLSQPWERYDYRETVLKYTGVDILKADLAEMEKKLAELKIDYDRKGFNITRAIDNLWKFCRKQISGPGFLVGVPVAVSPLAKRDDTYPELTQRFQPIIAGSELGNGYSELNDPLDQLERFNEQAKLREAGDDEAQMKDEEFVEALEYGMPPTCGYGMSERVFSFLANKTVRECQIFPLLKPKHNPSAIKLIKPLETKVVETNSEDSNTGLTYKQAEELLAEHITEPNILSHSLATSAIMRELAKELQADEEAWAIVGLLHDLDWQETKTNTEQHSVKTAAILRTHGASQWLINTIISHCYGQPGAYQQLERKSAVEHLLTSAETLSGLIVAATLIRPDKLLSGLSLSSLLKKYKNKAFAANCSRKRIAECTQAGLSEEHLMEIALSAMQSIANDLGL
ncbi:lysine--tRNA ligase [Candidatus Falkowbacteria bacterium]|nr:lysine--tRNA ligase [Candidatus Falkowbacteria bacterium]